MCMFLFNVKLITQSDDAGVHQRREERRQRAPRILHLSAVNYGGSQKLQANYCFLFERQCASIRVRFMCLAVLLLSLCV